MPTTFILSDESINTYGFRVLTDGIDTTDFEKNPVMFFGHASWDLPIGRWENIRKEGGKLLADAVFDSEDLYAQKIESKVRQGILRATSIGFDIINTSAEDEVLEQGQTRATVTSSSIFEASIVSVPANKNALRLRKKGNTIELAATEKDISELLPSLRNQNLLAETILELGRMKGVVTNENEEEYKAIVSKTPDVALQLFKKASTAPQSLISALLNKEEKHSWDFDEWSKKDPKGLLAMKRNNPEKYEALVKGL